MDVAMAQIVDNAPGRVVEAFGTLPASTLGEDHEQSEAALDTINDWMRDDCGLDITMTAD
jgi:hypothetical protein